MLEAAGCETHLKSILQINQPLGMANGHDVPLLLDLRRGHHRLFDLFHGVNIIGLPLNHQMNVSKVALTNKPLDEEVICIHAQFAGLLHDGTNCGRNGLGIN